MRKFYVIGFTILLIFDTLAQVSFKVGAMHTAPAALDTAWISRVLMERWLYLAILSYLGAFVTYMTLLKHAPIGPAFAASHLEIVTVLIISVGFLGEKLTGLQIVGSILILAGVIVLASRRDAAD